MLTLEKLAPYLPHNIKAVEVGTELSDPQIREVSTITFTYTTKYVGMNHLLYRGMLLLPHKLLLHPLSDLTKPITVPGYNDGKEFVPARIYYDGTENGLSNVPMAKEYLSCGMNINKKPHWWVALLYKFHFAINISPEDYIDINSISS